MALCQNKYCKRRKMIMKQKKEYEKGIINNNNGSVYVRTSKYPKVTKKTIHHYIQLQR